MRIDTVSTGESEESQGRSNERLAPSRVGGETLAALLGWLLLASVLAALVRLGLRDLPGIWTAERLVDGIQPVVSDALSCSVLLELWRSVHLFRDTDTVDLVALTDAAIVLLLRAGVDTVFSPVAEWVRTALVAALLIVIVFMRRSFTSQGGVSVDRSAAANGGTGGRGAPMP